MFGRWFVAVLVLIGGVLSVASPAAAHTDFESSTPADGDVVNDVVSEIVIRFTGEATPAGDGFKVLLPDGVLRGPSSVTTDDDKVFVLRFDPPLPDGVNGVRWMVQAQDAHPIEGSFSFTVVAPAPTTVSPTIVAAPATTAGESTPVPGEASGSTEPPAGGDEASGDGVSLEEFLAAESSTPGEGRQRFGRIVSFLGVIGAVGGLAFLAFTLRGTRREIDNLLAMVMGLGALTVVGAGIEYSGWLAQSDGTVFGEMTSTPGLAMTLRMAGGVVVAGSIAAAVWYTGGAHRRIEPARSLSASAVIEARPSAAVSRRRWDPRTAPVALAGATLLVASFWFDGHTVSQGPRVVHAALNVVHVVAAAVWAGGVLALLSTLVARHRRGEPGRAAELIVRFSSIATVALTAVVVAGAVMALFVLDAPGDLTSTEWGKILLLKSGAVGLAALGGAYNHFRLRPQFEAAPDDVRLEAEFRSTLVAESIVLIFVIVATAWLVAAAT